MIYLDNAATTRPCPAALDAMRTALEDAWGNPSALYRPGQQARKLVEDARRTVARVLHAARPAEITFTSGGTESDVQALYTGAALGAAAGKRHIISTQIEHHAVLHPMQQLEAQGFEVTYLQPDETGFVSVETLKAALRPDTILVSIMMVNNESGAVMPIAEMVRATRRLAPLALFHTDAVQGFLKVPFKAKTLGADLISISGHKVHGPKGVGALYIKPGLPLPAFIHGGGQEGNFRSGTENVPGICGFSAAVAATDAAADIAKMARLRDLARELLPEVPGLVLIGAQEAPHIVNLSLPGVRSQGIINCLQSEGIFVSAGSACSKGHRSHVLEAMKLAPAVIDGSVRVSFSAENEEQDVYALREALWKAKQTLKG